MRLHTHRRLAGQYHAVPDSKARCTMGRKRSATSSKAESDPSPSCDDAEENMIHRCRGTCRPRSSSVDVHSETWPWLQVGTLKLDRGTIMMFSSIRSTCAVSRTAAATIDFVSLEVPAQWGPPLPYLSRHPSQIDPHTHQQRAAASPARAPWAIKPSI